MKRCFDFTVAACLLVLLMPVFGTLMLVQILVQGRPVFFIQKRPGFAGVPFNLIKFRTMKEGGQSGGEDLDDSERMTPFGFWLRKTSLDELPELWNVVKGEMSLVGPRPLLMEYMPLYDAHQMRRHEVRPGLTGWAQVNGRNAVSWQERFEMDVWYVDNHSLWLDLKILVRTVWKVIRCEGISEEGQVTMTKFTGNRT